MKPTLYIFSGLPACGKSTLSRLLASHLKATHIRIDTIEQGLRDLCSFTVEGEGYRLSYRIAKDNLNLGNSVIADSVNPIELTRNEWQEVATSIHVNYINIEIICSKEDQHRYRLENRARTIKNLNGPTWQDVLNREYEPWSPSVITVDTADKTVTESFDELLAKLNL